MKKSFSEIIEDDMPVLVDFHATWCGPCHAVSPTIQQLAREYAGKAKVIKIDVDKNPDVAQLYQVRGVPTFILFQKGKILWRQSGALPAEVFRKALALAE